MKTLAIETSGATFSIAVSENGYVISEIYWHSGLTHSERLLPSINKLLEDVGWDFKALDKIAVSTGPGSFTGIRVGLTCARTISQNLKIPLVGINTLDILADSMPACGCCIYPAIDALRNELYIKGKKNEVEIISAEIFLKKLSKEKQKILIVGNAAKVYLPLIKKILKNKAVLALDIFNYPRAGALCLLAEKYKGVQYDKVKPLYIRRSWAEENQK